MPGRLTSDSRSDHLRFQVGSLAIPGRFTLWPAFWKGQPRPRFPPQPFPNHPQKPLQNHRPNRPQTDPRPTPDRPQTDPRPVPDLLWLTRPYLTGLIDAISIGYRSCIDMISIQYLYCIDTVSIQYRYSIDTVSIW